MLKKTLAAILCAVLIMTLLPVTIAEEEKALNLFTLEFYVDDETIAQFEKETGIKVYYTNFNTNEEMLLKLQNAKGGDYDLIIASDYILNIARKQNLLQKLDKGLIPNYANLDAASLSQ